MSGVFPTVDALESRGAQVSVHDPLFTDSELENLGFVPHSLGNPIEIAIIQADHAEYQSLTPEDFPGIRLLADGRNTLHSGPWSDVHRISIGMRSV